MSFRLDASRRPSTELKRIAREQAESAIIDLDGADRLRGVHEARKRLKMLRAVLRLVREPIGPGTYERENTHLRDAGRRLSALRDADVLVAAFDGLGQRLPPAQRARALAIRRRLARDRTSLRTRALDESIASARATLLTVRDGIDRWPLARTTMGDIVEGLSRNYGRGRRAFGETLTDCDDDGLHEWRKRVKDLWYHLRLLRSAWPAVIKPWVAEAHHLAELLGDDHDLAVLIPQIGRDTERPADRRADVQLQRVILARRGELQREARALGQRLYAERTRELRSRVHSYCDAWRHEGATPASRDAKGESGD